LTIDSKDYRVPPNKKVDLGKWPTLVDPYSKSKKQYKELLQEHMEKLSSLQQLHYASHRYALLLIFQGMDGAGKGVELPLRIDSKQVIENTRR
jgi:polyphosphate kinase 2 (PPK2 family)